MRKSDIKEKLYKRNLSICKKILDKETLQTAKELREKTGFRSSLTWLNKEKIEQKKLIIDIFFKNKETRKNFLEFWTKLAKNHIEYTYIIFSDSAEYFLAEVFFTGKAPKNTLENTNLTGVEWIDYRRYEEEHCLYLKISPSATLETINDFLTLPENKLSKAFDNTKNLYYKKLTVRESHKETENTRDIIRKLKKLDTEKLLSVAKSSNSEAFENKLTALVKAKEPRLKDNIIAFVLTHQYGKKEYSEGYIRSIPKKTK